MRSKVAKRSIVIGAHKTSVSLEDEFWSGVKEIARSRQVTLSELVGELDARREHGNLSSAIRLFVLDHYRAAIVARPVDGACANGALPVSTESVHQSGQTGPTPNRFSGVIL